MIISVNTNFQGKKMPKEKGPRNSLSKIMVDSVIKAKKKYYPQTPLEECRYESQKIKIMNLVDDDLGKSLSDEPNDDSKDETESVDESNE